MTPADNADDTAQNAGNETASQAPAGNIPEEAPGFVGEILEEISADATGLGEAIREIVSGANPAEVAAVAVDIAAVIPL